MRRMNRTKDKDQIPSGGEQPNTKYKIQMWITCE